MKGRQGGGPPEGVLTHLVSGCQSWQWVWEAGRGAAWGERAASRGCPRGLRGKQQVFWGAGTGLVWLKDLGTGGLQTHWQRDSLRTLRAQPHDTRGHYTHVAQAGLVAAAGRSAGWRHGRALTARVPGARQHRLTDHGDKQQMRRRRGARTRTWGVSALCSGVWGQPRGWHWTGDPHILGRLLLQVRGRPSCASVFRGHWLLYTRTRWRMLQMIILFVFSAPLSYPHQKHGFLIWILPIPYCSRPASSSSPEG